MRPEERQVYLETKLEKSMALDTIQEMDISESMEAFEPMDELEISEKMEKDETSSETCVNQDIQESQESKQKTKELTDFQDFHSRRETDETEATLDVIVEKQDFSEIKDSAILEDFSEIKDSDSKKQSFKEMDEKALEVFQESKVEIDFKALPETPMEFNMKNLPEIPLEEATLESSPSLESPIEVMPEIMENPIATENKEMLNNQATAIEFTDAHATRVIKSKETFHSEEIAVIEQEVADFEETLDSAVMDTTLIQQDTKETTVIQEDVKMTEEDKQDAKAAKEEIESEDLPLLPTKKRESHFLGAWSTLRRNQNPLFFESTFFKTDVIRKDLNHLMTHFDDETVQLTTELPFENTFTKEYKPRKKHQKRCTIL